MDQYELLQTFLTGTTFYNIYVHAHLHPFATTHTN